jgi:WD40 repeat protein
MNNSSEVYLLKQREILSKRTDSSSFHLLGYSEAKLRAFSRYDSFISHNGCVNSVRWSKNGDFLITGSDDRTVKLWSTKRNMEELKLSHSILTKHRGNIFCADISPDNPSLVVSCAADGSLQSNVIGNSHSNLSILNSTDIM